MSDELTARQREKRPVPHGTWFHVQSSSTGGSAFVTFPVTGTVTRYDTQGTFASQSAWATFDATTLNANAQGFLGAVFDGRYLYLVPSGASELARYDTHGPFTTGGSWTTFDTTMANANATTFLGAGFDGQYIYLAAFPPGSSPSSTVALRYDPSAGLAASSFEAFDVASVSPSPVFAGAAFDGRFVYLAPEATGKVARYDTQDANFGSASSWSLFDLSSVSATASGFHGAVFDGKFVYFVPGGNGTVARFDAKTPPSMPTLPGWNGSFL